MRRVSVDMITVRGKINKVLTDALQSDFVDLKYALPIVPHARSNSGWYLIVDNLPFILSIPTGTFFHWRRAGYVTVRITADGTHARSEAIINHCELCNCVGFKLNVDRRCDDCLKNSEVQSGQLTFFSKDKKVIGRIQKTNKTVAALLEYPFRKERKSFRSPYSNNERRAIEWIQDKISWYDRDGL